MKGAPISTAAALHKQAALTSDEAAGGGVTEQERARAAQLLAGTAPVQFGPMCVAPALTAFAQHHPRVRCRVLLFDRVVNLLDEGIDVGVRIGALDDSALVARHVGTIRRVVVASPALLDSAGTPAQPQALRGARCIRFTGAAALGWRFDMDGRKVTVEIGGNLEFNHIAPAVDACAAGAGFGMFLSYQVAPLVASGRLRVVLEAFEPPPRPVHVVYPHARLLPRRTRLCIDWLKQSLTGPDGPFGAAEPAGMHGEAARA